MKYDYNIVNRLSKEDTLMKKIYLLFSIFLTAVLLLGACSSNKETTDKPEEPNNSDVAPSNTAAGKKLVMDNCASCHSGQFESFATKYNADELEDIIENGKGSMPKELLQGEDLKQAVEYIINLK